MSHWWQQEGHPDKIDLLRQLSPTSVGTSEPTSKGINDVKFRRTFIVGGDVTHAGESTTLPTRLAAATAGLSGVVVSSLSADAASSTSLRLTWQLLQPQRQVVDGFRVRYRSLDDSDDDQVDYLAKTVRPGDVRQFLLTGASVCHLSFSVRTFHTRSTFSAVINFAIL